MGIRDALVKRKQQQRQTAKHEDAFTKKSCPALAEYLATAEDEGKPIETPQLMVFVEGSVWKAVLTDRQECCKLWASGDTLEGLFKALERQVTCENPDWQDDQYLLERKRARQPQKKRVK